MAGYSETPLIRKLGLEDGSRAYLGQAPHDYNNILQDSGANFVPILTGQFDWIQAFYTEKNQLKSEFAKLKAHLKVDGQLWISWPKKSSLKSCDLDENIIRELGLAQGLVDVKVVAIDKTWSGLKFVYRLSNR